MPTNHNPVSSIICSNHFRKLQYPTLFADVALPIKRFRNAPRDSLQELIRCLKSNQNEFWLSLAVVLSQLLVLLVVVVLAMVFSLFACPWLIDFVNHFHNAWLDPLIALPVLAYFFSPVIFLFAGAHFHTEDEASDNTAISTEDESESPPSTELVPRIEYERTEPDESHLSPIQRYRKNPRDFVLSNLVFALQTIFFSSCCLWAIIIIACILT